MRLDDYASILACANALAGHARELAVAGVLVLLVIHLVFQRFLCARQCFRLIRAEMACVSTAAEAGSARRLVRTIAIGGKRFCEVGCYELV